MAATNAGAMELQNQGFVTNIASGQYTSGSLGAPLAVAAIAQATPAVQASLASANSVQIPISTPVVVEASARAAAAQEAARVAALALPRRVPRTPRRHSPHRPRHWPVRHWIPRSRRRSKPTTPL